MRLAAQTHEQLQDLIQQILAVPGVGRTTTLVVLTTPVRYRVLPLLHALTRDLRRGRTEG